jgi:hypothetical protein
MLSDRISLTNLSGLNQALQGLPDSRPDVVERAQSLIADPNYPSASLLTSLSQKLAASLSSNDQ